MITVFQIMGVFSFFMTCVSIIWMCHRLLRFFENLETLMVKQSQMLGQMQDQLTRMEHQGYYVSVPAPAPGD